MRLPSTLISARRTSCRSLMSVAALWCLPLLGGALLASCGHDLTAVTEPEPPPPLCTDVPVVRLGRATYYTFADGGGACTFDPTPGDLFVAAMNSADYGNAIVCGMTVRVTGPKGEVTVRIVDRCPGCSSGDLDLSPQAFAAIADLPAGNVPIQWHMVPSAVTGPLQYHFKTESSQWWTAVQVRNSRFPVRSLEYLTAAGAFAVVARTDYNYFVATAGIGKGPYVFRVTDLFGRTIIDSAIVLAPNTNVSGKFQFPLCPP